MGNLSPPGNVNLNHNGRVVEVRDSKDVVIAILPVCIAQGTLANNGTSAVTVACLPIEITDSVEFSLNTVGGTVGAIPRIDTITAGVGFTTKGTASDTSTYNYKVMRTA